MSAINRRVTEKGEQGASAMRISRAGLGIMEQFQHAFAVGEDRLLILHDLVGRQAAVLLRQVHRTARHRHAQAELARLLDFDVDRILQPGGKR